MPMPDPTFYSSLPAVQTERKHPVKYASQVWKPTGQCVSSTILVTRLMYSYLVERYVKERLIKGTMVVFDILMISSISHKPVVIVDGV